MAHKPKIDQNFTLGAFHRRQ